MAEHDEEYVREECLNNDEMRKVFVAGIPSDAQNDALKSWFEGICGGTVTDCHIVRKEGQSEKKNLIGFVTFATSELVDEVLLKRGSLTFNGKELEVNRAVPKTITWMGAHEKTKKLFIANLPRDAKEDELEAYLKARHPKKYGLIEKVQLIKVKNPDGSRQDVNKGYGFIFVSSEDMADKMAIQHATFTYGGRKIELKKNVTSGGAGEGGRGRGRGRGGDKGMRGGGGRGGGQFQGYGGGYDGGYGGQQQYGGGYDAGGYGAGGGYDASGGYGTGGGYGAGGYGSTGGGYDAGYGANGGYGGGYEGGYGGGYGGGPAAAAGGGRGAAAAGGGRGGGRGRGRGGAQGGNRFQPY